jgi:hypothetical protein
MVSLEKVFLSFAKIYGMFWLIHYDPLVETNGYDGADFRFTILDCWLTIFDFRSGIRFVRARRIFLWSLAFYDFHVYKKFKSLQIKYLQ